jgi:hypothetical protein
MRKPILAVTMLALGLALGACDDDNQLEDTVEEAGDEIEDAAEEIDD